MTQQSAARAGAIALPGGMVIPLGATYAHPSHEDPMNDPVVFLEYARSDTWVALMTLLLERQSNQP